MTKEEFKFIWETMIVANGPWYLAASDENTSKLYRDKLSRYDKDVLSKAVDKLLVDETGRLPPVGKFIEYCRWVKGERPCPNLKLCPCCKGDGWIYLKGKNAVAPCGCNNETPEKYRIPVPKRCEVGECDPGGKVFIDGTKRVELDKCPKGEAHYKKYVTKNMEKQAEPLQKDLPGVGEEEMPF
jgi:hypothetical protein